METIDLGTLTLQAFEPLAGTVFSVTYAGQPVALRISGMRSHGWSRPGGREAFTVSFRGPRDPLLSQGMYALEAEAMGRLDGLFLVPVGRDAGGSDYEAVFT